MVGREINGYQTGRRRLTVRRGQGHVPVLCELFAQARIAQLRVFRMTLGIVVHDVLGGVVGRRQLLFSVIKMVKEFIPRVWIFLMVLMLLLMLLLMVVLMILRLLAQTQLAYVAIHGR